MDIKDFVHAVNLNDSYVIVRKTGKYYAKYSLKDTKNARYAKIFKNKEEATKYAKEREEKRKIKYVVDLAANHFVYDWYFAGFSSPIIGAFLIPIKDIRNEKNLNSLKTTVERLKSCMKEQLENYRPDFERFEQYSKEINAIDYKDIAKIYETETTETVRVLFGE